MVIQWFHDIYVHPSTWIERKCCFVMTKILCAVNTNFSILVSSLYRAYVHKDSFFSSSSSFPFIVNVNSCRRRRMLFQKAACMLLLPAFRSIGVIRYFFMRTVPRSVFSVPPYTCTFVRYTLCTSFYILLPSRSFVLFVFACTFSPLQ